MNELEKQGHRARHIWSDERRDCAVGAAQSNGRPARLRPRIRVDVAFAVRPVEHHLRSGRHSLIGTRFRDRIERLTAEQRVAEAQRDRRIAAAA